MIPYADLLSFGVLLYVAVPTLLLGLAGRGGRWWLALATAAMLAAQYGGATRIAPGIEVRELWLVAGYGLWAWAVARGFLALRTRGAPRLVFHGALLLAALPLAVVKLATPLAPAWSLGFLGLSWVTLRSLDVVICTQDRLITALPPLQFLTYVFFFPTVSAGPIDRYRRFAGDWARRRTRAELLHDLDGAVARLFRGALYKFVLAALVRDHWLEPAAARTGFAATVSYMYAYSAYLFFDFAGYTAFAVGVSYLFGIHTPENFDRPFLARNIREFWNRWNITLSWWLRDHVYMRFVMAATRGRWFGSRAVTSALGLFLAFGLMGLWHGTSANYVLYGLYHGALLSAHEAFARWNARRRWWGDGPFWQAAAVLTTAQFVCFGFLLFSGRLTGDAAAAAPGDRAWDGAYEHASCDELAGWAWDARQPGAPVRVEVLVDGRVAATATADLFRPDLAAAGRGDGAHAFVVVPPDALRDGWPHETRLRIAGSDVELAGGPRQLVCGDAVENLDGRGGSLEPVTCTAIVGAAWDTTQPERVVSVDVYDGPTKLATVAADQPPAEAGGPRRFVYLPPASLRDGRPHSLAVRLAGTNVLLQGAPQVLTCGGAAAPPAPAAPAPTPAAAGAPDYVDNRDGTISGRHNGLMWEKKVRRDGAVDAADLHDADNCYPWFGACAGSGAECRVDADCGGQGPCAAADCQTPAPDGLTIFAWVERLNQNRFAGHADWRLPDSTELYSVVNPMEAGDAATKAAFSGSACGADCRDLRDPACSCTHPGLYWAVPRGGRAPDESWMGFFYCNDNLFLDLKNNRFRVRAVRGGR